MFDDFIKSARRSEFEKIEGTPWPNLVIPRRSHGKEYLAEPSFFVWFKSAEPLEVRVVTKVYEGYFECRELTASEFERFFDFIHNPSSETKVVNVLGDRYI